MKLRKIYSALLIVFFQLSFSQLSDFNLQVTATNETCSGNGTLSFLTTNTTVGATIVYNVFLVPNTTTPIATTSNSTLTGLNAGNYQVVASQTLAANTNTQQQNVSIINQVQNLSFTISDQKVKCGNDGILTVNVTTGTAISYEILTGPVMFPAQSSNVFINLPIGNYSIRVFDNCGNAVVNSFTLTQNYTPVTIYWVSTENLNCNTVKLTAPSNISQTNIVFPLNVEYKVFPPNNGIPIVYNQTINSFNFQGISQVIPRFNENYSYDVKITDGCGNLTQRLNVPINFQIGLNISSFGGCPSRIELSVYNTGSYNVEFLTSPSGFNPILLNPEFPGPYSNYADLFVEPGFYEIKITDGCGNSAVDTIQVNFSPMPVLPFVTQDGCGTIQLTTYDINNYFFQNVTLISAPINYNATLPVDLSSSIVEPKKWLMSGFIPGNYVFHILDNCGNLFIQNITVLEPQNASFFGSSTVGCEVGFGNIKCSYGGFLINNYKIQNAIITNAPPNFQFSLPYTVPTSPNSSVFDLTNIPEGIYTVQMTSVCGHTQINNFIVNGYVDASTNIELQQFCSSFNLKFLHLGHNQSYYTISSGYSLQKFDEVNQVWVHPITNQQIINNQINSNNIFSLLHNQWNLNLNFTGKFRILKFFRVPNNEFCVKVIKEFQILGVPVIESTNVLNCTNENSILVVNASGNGNLIYRITQKDGQPFIINNGNNNVFGNLISGTYNLQVEDVCGNIVNQIVLVSSNNQFQIVSNLCENQISTLYVPNFSFLQYQWVHSSNPNIVISNSNELVFNPLVLSQHSGQYLLNITHINQSDSCLNMQLTYVIQNVLIQPSAGQDNFISFCGKQDILDLNSFLLNANTSNGSWIEITNSGALNTNYWNTNNTSFGTYQFKYFVHGFCNYVDEAVILININEKLVVNSLPTSFLVCKNEDLEINPGMNNSNYSYQWTGPNNFSSTNASLQFTSIQNIANGQYTLIVGNNGCNSDVFNFDLEVISLPEFNISETCENDIKTLTAIPINGSFDSTINFNWVGPNDFTSSLNPIQIQSGNNGNYILTIDKNSCEISKGLMVNSTACEIQNGISPNDDGLNDYFDLSGFDVNAIKIFNRYGLEVYSKENGYKKEWNGQAYNGNFLPDATYFYVIKFNSGLSKTGWIFLTR